MAHQLPGKILISTLGVAGVGLIGGSIAAAARERRLCERIIGFGRSADRLEAARNAGFLDHWSTSLAELSSVDLLVVCLPVGRIAPMITAAADRMPAHGLITDAGSVKQKVCEAVGNLPDCGACYVPAHPLAGSEKQGYEHARADLFEGRVCVICPPTPASQLVTAQQVASQLVASQLVAAQRDSAVRRVEQFWRDLGCRTLRMSPVEHDRALALTSHLPHLAAAMIASLLPPGAESLAATGFRDVTRIAGGDPELWVEILSGNRAAVEQALKQFSELCSSCLQALHHNGVEDLRLLLQHGQNRRRAFEQAFEPVDPTDVDEPSL